MLVSGALISSGWYPVTQYKLLLHAIVDDARTRAEASWTK
jgi:hypothetical protein